MKFLKYIVLSFLALCCIVCSVYLAWKFQLPTSKFIEYLFYNFVLLILSIIGVKRGENHTTNNPRHSDVDKFAKSSLGEFIVKRPFFTPKSYHWKHYVLLFITVFVVLSMNLYILNRHISIEYWEYGLIYATCMAYGYLGLAYLAEIIMMQPFLNVFALAFCIGSIFFSTTDRPYWLVFVNLVGGFYALTVTRFLYNYWKERLQKE